MFLQDLPPDTVLEIQTQHHCYTAVLLVDNSVLISGHPQYCPQPVVVAIAGSSWEGSMLKRRFVSRGIHLRVFTWRPAPPHGAHQPFSTNCTLTGGRASFLRRASRAAPPSEPGLRTDHRLSRSHPSGTDDYLVEAPSRLLCSGTSKLARRHLPLVSLSRGISQELWKDATFSYLWDPLLFRSYRVPAGARLAPSADVGGPPREVSRWLQPILQR